VRVCVRACVRVLKILAKLWQMLKIMGGFICPYDMLKCFRH